MEIKRWNDKPYNNLDYHLKSIYGKKIYKIAIDGGMTCPNRDGSIDTRGCIFCSKGGSGEFAASFDVNNPSVLAQLEKGKELIAKKTIDGTQYIAYFQPYSNTYASIEYLNKLYEEALSDSECVGLSIGTRPDCLSSDVLELLNSLKEKYEEKLIWIELGLQTIHRDTAIYIRRGYELSRFEEAVSNLNNIGIPIIVHLILGLPGETTEMMYASVEYLNTFNIFGVKLQLLHVLNDTDLMNDYNDRKFDVLSQEEYTNILIGCIERLNPEIVIHRVTGDGPKDKLIAPDWSKNKRNVLNTLLSEMKKRNTWQGRLYEQPEHIDII